MSAVSVPVAPPVQHDAGLPSLARSVGKKNLKPYTPPPEMNPEDIPWRGHGGRAPTYSGVEFDRQLDKISVWLENWNHEQRCKIVEGLLRRSNYNQFQFLNTTLQPMLHRDFMYTAKTHFPAVEFVPVSTHISRKLKEKLIFTRQDNYHRIKSAYYRDADEVKGSIQDKDICENDVLKFPAICNSFSAPPKLHKDKSSSNLSLARRSLNLKSGPEKWIGDGSPIYSNLSNISAIRYIDMPVRRHIQDENSPRPDFSSPPNGLNSHSMNTLAIQNTDDDRKLKKSKKTKAMTGSDQWLSYIDLPTEAKKLYSWYTQEWSDVKRNEFLHKFILKLDPRQHYFISSFLTARHYKDFISLLPRHIALRILDLLSVRDMLNSCMVCKAWNALANNNDLWKIKCARVKLEVPVLGEPDWKEVYRENKFLRVNWNSGKYRVTDLKGHADSVLCVIFDLYRLASGSVDKSIRVWDIKSGRCLHVLKGHVKGVWCLNFFTQNLLISGSYDTTIRVWNLRTGKCQKTIFAHDGPIWAMCRRNDILVTASQDKTAKIWDINRCLLLRALTGHSAAVFAVDMSEDGKLVVTGSADKSVRTWNIETGRCQRWISVSSSTSIMAVSYSQGHLACSYGETICVYKVEGPTRLIRKYLDIVNEHQKRIECLRLQITDRDTGEGMIVSAGKDGYVKYWNTQKEKSVQTFIGHKGQEVNAIHFDELRIASVAQDNKIRIWDFNIK